MLRVILAFAGSALLGACTTSGTDVASASASAVAAPHDRDDEIRIAALVARMGLDRKVAQLIQPQINSFTAEDMRRYRFGSYLNGGNGGPYGDEFAPAAQWLKLADEMWDASTAPLPDGEPVIPSMWGTDAVHGHANVVGATVFPHNVGLGATRDADLLRRIGVATAHEMAVTGIDWNFSPTVAVAQDVRWGRSYESYSSDPAIVTPLGAALIEGLQGAKAPRIPAGHVLATAKHFFADGGTDRGVDQGDVDGDLAALKALHTPPYRAAIDAVVATVMASFNSVNGVKMHGNRDLLTGVLRGEFGFGGMVVGDWNAHGQVAGCKVDDCAAALNAGLDMYMVPDDWKALHARIVSQVRDGTIAEARIDEAVARVLHAKLRAGLLDAGVKRPSERLNGGKFELLGSPAHRALAREAVAKSQVVLKNDGVLPIAAGRRVLVAGAAADRIAQAAGGWTLTWQGGLELTNDPYFPGATSIWQGIADAANANGGSAALSRDGSYAQKPDVAVVVFGEEPYAEFEGDRKTAAFSDEEGLRLLRKFDAEGVPTVAVFLSGRPLWTNREINAADAFVASWLPGSEGAGVADVLFGKAPATGRLSFAWPAKCDGGRAGAFAEAFPIGFGGSLTPVRASAALPEDCAYIATGPSNDWFVDDKVAPDVSASAGGITLANLRGQAGGVALRGIDRKRQEDAREATFTAGASLTVAQSQDGKGAYRILYEIPDAPSGPVTLSVGGTKLDVTRALTLSAGKGWREMIVTGQCAPGLGNALTFASAAPLTLRLASIARENLPAEAACSL